MPDLPPRDKSKQPSICRAAWIRSRKEINKALWDDTGWAVGAVVAGVAGVIVLLGQLYIHGLSFTRADFLILLAAVVGAPSIVYVAARISRFFRVLGAIHGDLEEEHAGTLEANRVLKNQIDLQEPIFDNAKIEDLIFGKVPNGGFRGFVKFALSNQGKSISIQPPTIALTFASQEAPVSFSTTNNRPTAKVYWCEAMGTFQPFMGGEPKHFPYAGTPHSGWITFWSDGVPPDLIATEFQPMFQMLQEVRDDWAEKRGSTPTAKDEGKWAEGYVTLNLEGVGIAIRFDDKEGNRTWCSQCQIGAPSPVDFSECAAESQLAPVTRFSLGETTTEHLH